MDIPKNKLESIPKTLAEQYGPDKYVLDNRNEAFYLSQRDIVYYYNYFVNTMMWYADSTPSTGKVGLFGKAQETPSGFMVPWLPNNTDGSGAAVTQELLYPCAFGVVVVSEEFKNMFSFLNYYQIPDDRRKQFDDKFLDRYGAKPQHYYMIDGPDLIVDDNVSYSPALKTRNSNYTLSTIKSELLFTMPPSPVRAIIITQNTLGVQNMYLSVSGDNQYQFQLRQQPPDQSASMITVPCINMFVWATEKQQEMKKISYYSPNLVAGQSVYVPPQFGSMRRIQLSISWLDAYNNMHPLKLSDDETCMVQLSFIPSSRGTKRER